jgi:hypothetical protein
MEKINNENIPKIISPNQFQPNQFVPTFDIEKDFEMRKIFENSQTKQNLETKTINSEQDISTQMDMMIQTLPYMNDNIRANIKFGIEIYKTLNNFDRNYIHKVINELPNKELSKKPKNSK